MYVWFECYILLDVKRWSFQISICDLCCETKNNLIISKGGKFDKK